MLTERLKLPPDVANGILFTLLKNVQRSTPKTTVSYVAATPKPRVVHLEIIPHGQNPFSIGSYTHKATHYIVKVKICLERVRERFQSATFLTAQELCLTILEAAQQFMRAPPTHNDVTTLALLRDV